MTKKKTRKRPVCSFTADRDLLEWFDRWLQFHGLGRTEVIGELLTALREGRLSVVPCPPSSPAFPGVAVSRGTEVEPALVWDPDGSLDEEREPIAQTEE